MSFFKNRGILHQWRYFMASINRYQTINDIPASKGKDVLLKILNSPKADFSKLQKIAVDYEKKALEMIKTESKDQK